MNSNIRSAKKQLIAKLQRGRLRAKVWRYWTRNVLQSDETWVSCSNYEVKRRENVRNEMCKGV